MTLNQLIKIHAKFVRIEVIFKKYLVSLKPTTIKILEAQNGRFVLVLEFLRVCIHDHVCEI